MPRDKDLKRLVRARMKKTGEAYTAARANVLKKSSTKKTAGATRTPAATALAPDEYAKRAGMSDAAISARTGKAWQPWTEILDSHGAASMSHREIFDVLHEQYGLGTWWAQSVAVGYERIRGLRARGQRRDGSYEATKSRTYGVPVTTLFDAWNDAATRRRWLSEPGAKVRSATSPKAMRIGWSDGTVVIVGFTAKGKGKSQVALAHTKLSDKATSDRLKTYWTERLEALGKLLAER